MAWHIHFTQYRFHRRLWRNAAIAHMLCRDRRRQVSVIPDLIPLYLTLTLLRSSRTDLWPKQFDLQVTQPACSISDLQGWIRAHDVPLCMFMPDRHLVGRANEAQFRSLAQLLTEHQMV